VANTRATAAISMVIMVTTLVAEKKERTDEDRPTVFVHLENHAAVPPETVAGARDELAHIYDAVGVRVESSAEPNHSRCALQLTVHVVLLGGAAAERFIKAEHVKRKVLAQANSDARRVYVFWERVGPSVDHQAVWHGDALGLVIAHELGHVLLPGRKHSRNGIMQENYNAHRSYVLKFSAEESAAMRAFIDAAKGNPQISRQ
jgi:hypothetical protein